jgi:hypothetical protein
MDNSVYIDRRAAAKKSDEHVRDEWHGSLMNGIREYTLYETRVHEDHKQIWLRINKK